MNAANATSFKMTWRVKLYDDKAWLQRKAQTLNEPDER